MSGQNRNNQNGPNGRPPVKNQFLKAAALAAALFIGFNMVSGGDDRDNSPEAPPAPTSTSSITYNQYQDKLRSGNAERVVTQQQGNDKVIFIEMNDGSTYSTIAMDDPNFMRDIENAGVETARAPTAPPPQPNKMFQMLLAFGPIALIIGLVVWKMKQGGGMGAGRGGPGGVGNSKAKLQMQDANLPTFDDVAGIEEAKEDLQELVDFLRNPRKFQHLGGKMPTGVLMVGPPGTGKTLTAKAVAGEAQVPFFTTSGSEFVEMYVGVGASRVRDLFAQAKKNAPCIIFIDEIDAVGRHRGSGMGGGNDEREQTLNQLLVEMDGFEENTGVIVIAATNRPDVLDNALKRPGRFDREVTVGLPDLEGRDKILKVHIKKIALDRSVDTKVIARGTPGFSGADLANLVNEAALLAARRNHKTVTMDDFEGAKDKIMMGAERRTLAMTAEDRKLTAYHEAGHAIVSYFEDGCDPIHKATIIPRGGALGMVVSLPERDQVSMSKKQLLSRLAMAYGGRVAEGDTFGEDNITTGASGDIQYASQIARRMVTEWGFSEKLGKVLYGNPQQGTVNKPYSESTEKIIDQEVKRLTDEAEEKARKIITDNHDAFVRLAETLLEYETLTGDEVGQVIRGETLERKPGEETHSKAANNNQPAPTTSVPPTVAEEPEEDFHEETPIWPPRPPTGPA